MNTRQWWLMMASVLVAGFLGGMVSNLLLAGFPVSAKSGAGAATAITAREFRLVDAHGALRAKLALDKGSPFLSFYNNTGKAQATVSVGAGGPTLDLRGNDGKSAVSMGVAAEGPAIFLIDSNAVTRLGCIVSGKISGLNILDGNGKSRAVLAVNDETGPRVRFNDADEQTLAWLGVDKTGKAGLSILANGLERVWLGMWDQGPGLGMWDTQDKERLQLMINGDTPSQIFFDGNGNKTWGAP